MQQQDAGPCEAQENSPPEVQEHTSEEVVAEPTSSDVQDENSDKDTVLETPASTTENELDTENGNSDGTSSDSPSTKSKPKQNSKKRHAKQEKGDIELSENKIPDNGLPETEIIEDVSTLSNNMANDVEEEEQYVTVHEPDEVNTLETDESGQTDFHAEDEKSESSQEVIEEELSISDSVSYEELNLSKDTNLEASEKYSLSVSSSELHPFTSHVSSEEKQEEHVFNSEDLLVSGSSWGGSIRSISARRPMRKSAHFVMQGRSSVSAERAGACENHSDTDCSVDTTEGSTFSSLKRKACEIDTLNSKKQKINDSKNSKFFSMVSSPLRMLRNKLSDRIVENPNAPHAEDLANGNEDDEDESINEKIKKESNEIKGKSHCVMANDVSSHNLYQSWCSLM